ncbi:hypothetical protein F5Y17DRAFT_459798 [Xylariaceae sp. FL0594]|nr:hypothetical protein F5Y17DRAFT_459798 [Xylariaceae sp. FL0594]
MEQNQPAFSPPPGVVPNLLNPPNGNVQAHVGLAISLLVVALGVSLRAYSRVFCIKKVKIEDFVALAALGPFIAFICGLYMLMNITGFYVHQWNIPLANLPAALYVSPHRLFNASSGINAGQIVYVSTSLFQATMGLLKTAILLEWPRLFVPPGRRNGFYWTCRITMVLNIGYCTVGVVASALTCTPHEKIWNISLPGRCLNTSAFFITNATLNVVSDIIILALPHQVIWSLQMSRKKKVGVSLVFTIGIIACLTAAVRLAKAVKVYAGEDVIYNISAVLLWGMAELAIAFVVFCLPAIPAVFNRGKKITWPSLPSHLWTRPTYDHRRALFRSEQPADEQVWKSSTFVDSVSLEAQEGVKSPEPVRQPYPAPKFRPYNSRQELGLATSSQTIYATPVESDGDAHLYVEPNKGWVHDSRHNPTYHNKWAKFQSQGHGVFVSPACPIAYA